MGDIINGRGKSERGRKGRDRGKKRKKKEENEVMGEISFALTTNEMKVYIGKA